MKLMEFNSLSQSEKIRLLYEDGVYVGKKEISGLSSLLYQLEGFYIEIRYKKYRQVIKAIYGFSDTKYLDPYLEKMDIVLLS